MPLSTPTALQRGDRIPRAVQRPVSQCNVAAFCACTSALRFDVDDCLFDIALCVVDSARCSRSHHLTKPPQRTEDGRRTECNNSSRCTTNNSNRHPFSVRITVCPPLCITMLLIPPHRPRHTHHTAYARHITCNRDYQVPRSRQLAKQSWRI